MTQWSSPTPFRKKKREKRNEWNAATLDRMMIYSICKVICMCQRCFFSLLIVDPTFPQFLLLTIALSPNFALMDWLTLQLKLKFELTFSKKLEMRMGKKTFSFLCNYENSNWEKYTKERKFFASFFRWCRACENLEKIISSIVKIF